MAKKATKKSESKPRPPRATVQDGGDEWVEPGQDTTRHAWQDYADLKVGEEKDAPPEVGWTQVRSSIRQVVKRVGRDKLRLVMKEVRNAAGEPTGRIIIKRLAPL